MKNHFLKVLALLVFAIAPLHAQSSFPDHCPNQSPIPFAAIELKHPIDSTCGIDGLPTASANSKGPTEESNDVHIAFGPLAGTQECDSVTAEITPHYRPASWNEIGHYEIWSSSTRQYVPNPALAAR